MVGGGEAVVFLEKPGRSKESKGRTRRWGQGCLEGLAVDASRCGWVVVEVGGQVTARAGAGIGFFSRRGWGFCRGSRALVRLWNGRNVGNRHFTLAINRRGSESDGVCDIWELLTRISCFLVEK